LEAVAESIRDVTVVRNSLFRPEAGTIRGAAALALYRRRWQNFIIKS
jgi:hypothetical protein